MFFLTSFPKDSKLTPWLLGCPDPFDHCSFSGFHYRINLKFVLLLCKVFETIIEIQEISINSKVRWLYWFMFTGSDSYCSVKLNNLPYALSFHKSVCLPVARHFREGWKKPWKRGTLCHAIASMCTKNGSIILVTVQIKVISKERSMDLGLFFHLSLPCHLAFLFDHVNLLRFIRFSTMM